MKISTFAITAAFGFLALDTASAVVLDGDATHDFQALNLTLGADLNMSGNLDVNGNTFAFGTSGTDFGLQLVYVDHITGGTSPAQIAFTANQPLSQWVFRHLATAGGSASVPMMKLDSVHVLNLYSTANSTTPVIQINPNTATITLNGLEVLTSTTSLQTGSSHASGDRSTALGGSTTSGSFSTAVGAAIATGQASTAVGQAAASGLFATAFGAGTANGQSSTSLGQATANGSSATAAGTSNATGPSAVALGSSNANGDRASAIGGATATGNLTTAFASSRALAVGSTAIGFENECSITGSYSTTIGLFCKAFAAASTTMGSNSETHGDYSTAIGQLSKTYGYGSSALGYLPESHGDYSTALGYLSVSNGFASTAVGLASIANGYGSAAIGYGTKADSYGQLVVGRFNKFQTAFNAVDINPNDELFTVGNGSDWGARSNAFVVKQNGDTAISGKLAVKGAVLVPQSGDLQMGAFQTGTPP